MKYLMKIIKENTIGIKYAGDIADKIIITLVKQMTGFIDRKKIVEVPLFPNYIFIKTPETKRFRVLDTFGVKGFIKFDGRPVLIKESEINNIMKLIECKSINVEQKFVAGNRIRICEGPFKDIQGIIYKKKGETRFCVKIESINQILSINLCSSWLTQIV